MILRDRKDAEHELLGLQDESETTKPGKTGLKKKEIRQTDAREFRNEK